MIRFLTISVIISIVMGSTGYAIEPIKRKHITNGNQLLEFCAAMKEPNRQFACMGYIAGVADTLNNESLAGTGVRVQFCLPEELSVGAMSGIVVE